MKLIKLYFGLKFLAAFSVEHTHIQSKMAENGETTLPNVDHCPENTDL